MRENSDSATGRIDEQIFGLFSDTHRRQSATERAIE